jgi:1,4-alpha-glucan branching enzyme
MIISAHQFSSAAEIPNCEWSPDREEQNGLINLKVNPDSIRVMMVGPKTFPPVIGGIETHVYEISTRLASRGINASVIVPNEVNRRSEELVQGVHVIRVPCIRNRFALKLSILPFVMNEFRKNRECIFHAHDATGGFAAAFCSTGRNLVYTMHGLGFHSGDWPVPYRQGIQFMQQLAIRKAAHVFCTDAGVLEAVRGYRKQAEILSNGVDVDEFAKNELTKPSIYDDDSFVFLFVGRIARIKGISTLLDAIRTIPPDERRTMKFIIIGDGPLVEEVRTAEKEIEEIRLLGRIDHVFIPPYFAHADAYVLPSISEGLPISLLEAMASGLPSIASDVGGISSLIGPSVVKLVPPGDAKALADAMIRLRNDEITRRGLAEMGRRFVTEHFSWDRVVDRLVDVYATIQSSRRP